MAGHEADLEVAARRKATVQATGLLTGADGDGYLTELRRDWPH